MGDSEEWFCGLPVLSDIAWHWIDLLGEYRLDTQDLDYPVKTSLELGNSWRDLPQEMAKMEALAGMQRVAFQTHLKGSTLDNGRDGHDHSI